MKRKYTRVISALLAVLLISTQPAVMTWADSMVPADHLLGGDEYIGKKTGYATPSDAEQKDEDALKPDDTPKDEEIPSTEIPSTEIPSTEIPSHENLTDGKQPEYENTEKMVVRWEFVDDENLSGGELSLIGVSPENRADFDTVVSMLPEQVRAEIEEAVEVTLPIADWSCPEYPQDEDGEWPFTGEYKFIAELPEGYVCEPPISVLVTLGGAMVNTINDRFAIDGLNYKELGPDTVQLIGYDGEKPVGTLVIPDKVRKPSNGRVYQVDSIGHNAFLDCSGLTGDLVIPDTVTEIGDNAFSGCYFTGELTLSDSLVAIGEYAFYECGFTGQLVLPQTLTRIGERAFTKTTFSGQLILPEKLNYIGGLAFYHCNFTGDLIIPDGVTIINYDTFAGNSFTGTLTLPKKLKEIGNESFYECGFTGELVLPDGLTSIGVCAFKYCSKLTGRLSIPDGITSIEHHAFNNTGFDGFDTTKQEIADLLYASGVDKNKIKVGNQSYQPASSPQEFSDGDMEYQVIGSDTVALIGYNGNSDTDISIPDKVTDQASGRTYSVTQIGSSAFYYKAITGSLHLPNTLVSIGDSAFNKNNFTGDLTIPASVSHMGAEAFESAGFTGDLTIEGKLTKLDDYVFFECGFTGALSLPDTLTYIGADAFKDCGFTGSLQLPAGITYIDAASFYNCSSFTGTLQLPAGVNYIGYYSFFNCGGFTGALQLPKPITEIGEMAFYGCDGLDSAHLGPNVQKLGAQVFPESLPLSTDSPRVQLLINTYLNQNAIADTSWDGNEDVPDGAVATIKQDTTVTGDRRIGKEAVITVPSGVILTVDGNLVVDGTISVEGTLIINGSLSGSGTLIIGVNGRVVGDTSVIRVEYPDDIEAAKKMIESQAYTIEQENAEDEAAVKGWLLKTIETISGFRDTGVIVGELKITGFVPASEGTSDHPDGVDGSFAFTLLLSKGNSVSGAGGVGTITARGYSHMPGSGSSGEKDDSNAVNPDILRGTWERTETGIWKFRQTSGAYAVSRWGMVDGLWYYFDGEGRMLTGWQFINNQWYYLCREEDSKTKTGLKEGAMATGWHFDPIYQAWFYLDTSGAMAVGQKVIDGKQYYFNPEPDGTRGAMQQ